VHRGPSGGSAPQAQGHRSVPAQGQERERRQRARAQDQQGLSLNPRAGAEEFVRLDARWLFLAGLTARLQGAIDAADLDAVTQPPDGAGISRSSQPDEICIDLRVLPSPVPRITLNLDPPADARDLCALWGITRPAAVSGDVHQRTWSVLVAGDELPDPDRRRIAARPLTAGRWDVEPRLTERPSGELPGVVCGASPAYDVRERGGKVRAIVIAASARTTRVLEPHDPDARTVREAMAAAFPVWRGGWNVRDDAQVVVLYHDGRPAAGAAIIDEGAGTAAASQLCVVPECRAQGLGAALLEALEAIALDRGFDRLRLDESAFLAASEVPHERFGYAVGPPYAGDTDVPVWAIKNVGR